MYKEKEEKLQLQNLLILKSIYLFFWLCQILIVSCGI